MKFSWQLTNSFLRIPEKSIENTLDKLILSGIEVEKIENTEQEKIIDLSITSNRKEINSTLSLAREISTTTDNILKIKPIKIDINNNLTHNTRHCLKYRRVHIIENNTKIKTPKWISDSLKIHGEYDDNYLKNIQEYINLKWGITFEIITSSSRAISNVDRKTADNNKLIDNIISNSIEKYGYNHFKLIIFDVYKRITSENYNNYDSSEFYENYYIDSMNIIKEATKSTIGKYYECYEKIVLENKEITLDKKTLNEWLGSYKSYKNKFLPIENIKKTLENLRFFSKYMKKKRLFIVSIPPYRIHDIENKIDVIEEIGKINEFKNFYNQYDYKRQKGQISNKLTTINKIRNTLRTLGFNEVVNCSINYSSLKTKEQLTIHNPISEEQKELRYSILIQLVNNYKHHIKYSNKNLLISEIGKVFRKDNLEKRYKEKQYIGGLIYAPKYNKINWSNNSEEINLYQVKGILEILFKQINSKIEMKTIQRSDTDDNIINIIKRNNKIGIYSENTNELIGIAGEINTKIKEFNSINNKLYAFEIDLEKVIKIRNYNIHLNYNRITYSNYPSIIRDISIPLDDSKTIEEVKKEIEFPEKELIETIDIFNEYKKKNENTNKTSRFVGIRITYRSPYRTLDIKDINKIDAKLLKIRNSIG